MPTRVESRARTAAGKQDADARRGLSPSERKKRDALVGKLRDSAAVKALSSGGRARLLAIAHRYGTSEAARENIQALGLDRDLARLSPKQQLAALQTLRDAVREKRVGQQLSQLVSDGDFRRLHDSTQRDVFEAVREERGDLQARNTLVGIARAAPFVQLDRTVRAQVLDAVGEKADLDQALLTLSDSSRFADLPRDTQQEILSVLSGSSANTAQYLAKVVMSEGFAALTPAERSRALELGTHPGVFGRSVASALHGIVWRGGFSELSAEAQAEKLREFLTQPHGNNPDIADRPRPYVIHGPTEVSGADFASGPQDALRYEVEIGGRRVPVSISRDQDASRGKYHSIDEVARALAVQPDGSVALVKEVRVDGHRNPADDHWAEVYGMPNFRSYMTAGASGIVSIYPSLGKPNQPSMNASFTHETGHILAGQRLGTSGAEGVKWSDWEAAIASDPVAPSAYGLKSRGEDFAEAFATYIALRATPEEALARRLMPTRFELLDRLLSAEG